MEDSSTDFLVIYDIEGAGKDIHYYLFLEEIEVYSWNLFPLKMVVGAGDEIAPNEAAMAKTIMITDHCWSWASIVQLMERRFPWPQRMAPQISLWR